MAEHSPAPSRPDKTSNQSLEPQHQAGTKSSPSDVDIDSDSDSLLAQLEAELDLSSPTTASILAARKAELQAQIPIPQQPPSSLPGGGYTHPPTHRFGIQTPANQESLIRATADAPAAIILFHSPTFPSSIIMKQNLTHLAHEYAMHNSRSARSEHRHHHHPHKQRDDDDESGHTVFFAAEAESHEWLCRRLGIKVLPVVVGYIAGKEVGRVVGFDELKGGEGAGWTGLGWILGRWVAGGREWSGTMGLDDAGVGGLLGVGWEDWVCGGGVAKDDGRRGGGDDGDDVDQRERRRDAGYVGGGDGNGRFRIDGRSGRQKRDVNDGDDDEDWD